MCVRYNIRIIIITLILYLINRSIKNQIPFEALRWFMCCYFNDLVGAVMFSSYCSLIIYLYCKIVLKLWQTELIMLFSGLFWEYITPFFRSDTVSDVLDVMAYMLGGFIYWLIMRNNSKENNNM